MERLLLRVREVAEAIGSSRSSVYTMIATNELPSVKIQGGVRVPAAALQRWIDEKIGRRDEA
jgi:excisionase family DNA binding protein